MESATSCHISGSAFIWARNGIAPSPLLFRTVKTGRSCKYKGQILKSMYEHVPSIDRGYLKVSDIHTVYYEIFGNSVGKPAVFLHGGPGAGCTPRHARFFDPRHYKVVLFDQRGCGKSTPCGCLEENTTWDLVEDLEKLRKHLRVNKWLVMGGSWGVTLALSYGQTHPGAVSGFLLRGVCMLRQEEIDWFYKQGANSLFPFAWDELLSVLEPEERTDVIPAFYKRLTSDNADSCSQAAKAWLRWEMTLSFFQVSHTSKYWDGKQYVMRSLEQEPSSKTINALEETKTDSAYSFSNQKLACVEAGKNHETTISKMTPQLAQARLECHYFLNAGFLKESQLLKGISKIRHIPCVIVHGRYDFVCPVKNAFDLHRAWPEAKLCIVMDAGHSMYEKGITRELLSATEQLMSVVS
ncbi:hypothetical protein L7F22_039481 [Adiantum nelumboides]|nr:hypothetical protein [Adiantum nelumboides]